MFDLIKRWSKFPILKIIKTNHNLRKLKLHINELYVFLDLDNTIYLFSEYGKTKEALENSLKEGYYEKIPIFPGAAAFVQFLLSICPNVYILSNCERDTAVMEKIESIKRDMPFFPLDHIIIGVNIKNKANLIKKICGKNKAVIVDDWSGNIIDAYLEGIVGIKKTYSGKSRPIYQVKEFYEILFVLKEKFNISFDLITDMKIDGD